jgi:hypothetical protein
MAGRDLAGGEGQRVLSNLPQGEARVNEANQLAGKGGSFGQDWTRGVGQGVPGNVDVVAGVGGFGSRTCARSGVVQEANGSIWRSVHGRMWALVRTWVCGETRVRECTGVHRCWLVGGLGRGDMRNDDKHGETPSETRRGGHQADLVTKKGGTLGTFAWRTCQSRSSSACAGARGCAVAAQ